MTAARAARIADECAPPPPVTRLRPVRGYAPGKEDYLRRLRKVEGQVRGLQKMIEAGTWCPDVVTQVASATRALQEVAAGLLNDHITHCVTAAARSAGGQGEARLGELTAAIRQVIRLLRGRHGRSHAMNVHTQIKPAAIRAGSRLARWRPRRPRVNITPAERAGRAVLGVAAVTAAAVLLAAAGSVPAVVLEVLLAAAGADLAVTGVLGHCPLYQRLGYLPRSLRRPS